MIITEKQILLMFTTLDLLSCHTGLSEDMRSALSELTSQIKQQQSDKLIEITDE